MHKGERLPAPPPKATEDWDRVRVQEMRERLSVVHAVNPRHKTLEEIEAGPNQNKVTY